MGWNIAARFQNLNVLDIEEIEHSYLKSSLLRFCQWLEPILLFLFLHDFDGSNFNDMYLSIFAKRRLGTKGQLISKGLFGILEFLSKTNKPIRS